MGKRIAVGVGQGLIVLALCTILATSVAHGAGEDSLGRIDVVGATVITIENVCQMTSDTVPSGGGPYQVDSIRADMNILLTVADVARKTWAAVWDRDSSLVGQSDIDSVIWETQSYYKWTFSDPKPTIYADSVYQYGMISENVVLTGVRTTRETTGGHQYITESFTYTDTPPDPITSAVNDGSAYVAIALYYSDLPATDVSRRPKYYRSSLIREAEEAFCGFDDEVPR